MHIASERSGRRDAAAEHARLGAMERRRAADGQAYTADEYRAWYHAAAQTLWDNAPEVRQASDGKWYTDTERAARKTGNVEQALAAPAAEQRQAAGAPAEAPQPARETGDVEQAPASSAAEQRQAAGAPAEAPEPAREQAPASPAAEQRQAVGAPAEAPEPARPKKFMPAKCIQEMCMIYPKLVKEYVARLPLGYGGPQCLVSRHDLRTLLDKACDMAMGEFKDDRTLQDAGYERRACRAGQGAAEDAHAGWGTASDSRASTEPAHNALDNPIFEDGVHKGRDFKRVTEEHPDFYRWLKHKHPPFLYFWERDYIEWFEARESDMMELVVAVEEEDSAQVSSASAAAEHANSQ